MTNTNAEELRTEIGRLMNEQFAEVVAQMPKGQLVNDKDSFTHALGSPLIAISRLLELSLKHPDARHMQRVRATANHGILQVANYLAMHLTDIKNELLPGIKSDTDVIINAVAIVRNVDEMAKQGEKVRQLNPLSKLCVDAAKILHKTVAFADQQMAESQTPAR